MGISDRVRILCERAGITINKLEKETGVGRGNVARWNKHQPSPDKLAAVAAYFSVAVDFLLGYGPEAYLFDLEVQIQETEKKISETENENEKERLYAELEALEENKADTELALSMANMAKTKKAPSEDGVTEEQIKFALAGDAGRVLTDEDMEKIRAFAAFTAQERGKK